MATCRVAAAIKMEKELGKIKLGFPAKFITFNDNLSRLESLNYNSI